MNTKERLLTIHIRNKLAVHPDYARALGIEVCPPLPRSGRIAQDSGKNSSSESTCI